MAKIYIDTPKKWTGNKQKKWCHMISEDVQELHKFANSIGIPKHRFENKTGRNQPHYDLDEYEFVIAIAAGAQEITSKELVEKLKQFFV